jgi:hypothetical protein
MPKIPINYKSHNLGYLYLFLSIGDIKQVFKIRKISKLLCRDLEKILKKIIGLNVSDQIDRVATLRLPPMLVASSFGNRGRTSPLTTRMYFKSALQPIFSARAIQQDRNSQT